MKKKNLLIKILLFLYTIMAVNFIYANDIEVYDFGSFFVLEDETVAYLEGEIESDSLEDFNEMIEEFPDIDLLVIINCEGSVDDYVNFEIMKLVRELEIATHLEDGGVIASGGVDLFLAGVKRTIGEDTKIGVHAWSDGEKSATDYKRGDDNHEPYIKSYMDIGMTRDIAEAFYYFTINAAPADKIHWMTPDEITRFNVTLF